tara:strand:- start:2335 stop:3102 length:768 start_codon:yes stop_codon:yes gene_type:complete
METNFLNMTEKQKDEPIFRITSINRLFQLFETRNNVLVRPKKWEDPFETVISESITKLKFEDEKDTTVGFRDDLYGQCWTRTRESDAMWRIYSPDKNGVRISTTPRKLLYSLSSTLDSVKNYSSYIGKVEYFSTPKLKDYVNKNVDKWVYFDIDGRGLANSLLFKRNAFRHENEVRLIYNSKFKGYKSSDIFSYRINPLELIDDIIFDPRIEYAEFKRHKKNLKEFRFNKKIVKSILYHIPDFKIKSKIFNNDTN